MTSIFRRLPLALGFILTIFAFCILAFTEVRAGEDNTMAFVPVDVIYLMKSPESPSGYKEKIRWTISSPSDWERFFVNIAGLPLDETKADPLKNKADDLIILTRNDANKLTGLDIYISTYGIMYVNRGAKHGYFADKNKFRKFLEEEQKLNASFESFGGKKIDPKSTGIVVEYNINQNMPNPSWLIDTPDMVHMYSSFLKGLKPYDHYELTWIVNGERYDDFGNFVLVLNYAGAPARIATITKKSIRLSNSFIETTYYQDPDDYYNFFKDQVRERINYNEKYKNQATEAIDKRQF